VWLAKFLLLARIIVQSYHKQFYKILIFTTETHLKHLSIALKGPDIAETATYYFSPQMRTLSGETKRNWKQDNLDGFHAEKWSRDIPIGRWNAAYSIGPLHCTKNNENIHK
jgi:hypothetical protein